MSTRKMQELSDIFFHWIIHRKKLNFRSEEPGDIQERQIQMETLTPTQTTQPRPEETWKITWLMSSWLL